MILRLSQPSLAGVRGGAELGNEADICKSIGFNHTNDKIHIPRTPREEERKILDEIFKDSKHFSKLKSCAKLILIFSKIIEKSSQGPNFYDFFCV